MGSAHPKFIFYFNIRRIRAKWLIKCYYYFWFLMVEESKKLVMFLLFFVVVLLE